MLADPRALVAGVFRDVLAPRERLTVSAWAERHRLSVPLSSRPGPWRNAVTPYGVAIMDAVSDPHVRRVTLVKSEQVAGTELLINCFGWSVENLVGPKLWVYPNESVAAKVNRERVLPSLRSIPPVAALLGTAREDTSSLQLRFNNGSFGFFVGSNSDANLEIFPFQLVIVDELDRCVPGVVGKVEGRTTSYPDHKILLTGTPGDEGFGIDASYAASDKRRWWTPCPACDRWHVRDDFPRVGWPHAEKEKFGPRVDGPAREAFLQSVERHAWYACPKCNHRITPAEHVETSARGVWLPMGYEPESAERISDLRSQISDLRALGSSEQPPTSGTPIHPITPSPHHPIIRWRGDGPEPPASAHAGFHVHGMQSTIAGNPFGKVAREFVAGGGRATRDWATRRLGKAWRVRGAKIEIAELRALCTPAAQGGYVLGVAPPGVLFLTCFCDVQADRAYIEVRGWGEMMLDTALVWCEERRIEEGRKLRELDDLLDGRWTLKGESGSALKIAAMAIDSSFFTDSVYEAVDRLRRRLINVFAFKGDGAAARVKPIMETPIGETTKIRRWASSTLPLLSVHSNSFKQALLERIAAERRSAKGEEAAGDVAGGRFLLPEDAPDEYLLQLTSEERITKSVKGQLVAVFEPRPGFESRNHYWDCAYGNLALATRMGIQHWSADQVEKVRAAMAAKKESGETARPRDRAGPPARRGRGILDKLRG